MASTNEVTISGYLTRRADIKTIQSGAQELTVCNGNLCFTEDRGDKQVESWIDVEAWGDLAFSLADMPENTEIQVKGSIVRRAWPNKKREGEWVRVHRVKAKEIVQSAADPDPQPKVTEAKGDWEDLPF